MNTTQYSAPSRFFHWFTAVCVLSLLVVGFLLEDFPKNLQGNAYFLHKSFGLLVLGLTVPRLLWNLIHTRPAYPASVARWEIVLARAVHGLLYFALFAMPLSGWIMSSAAGHVPSFFGWFSLPFPGVTEDPTLEKTAKLVHEAWAFTLCGLIGLHVLGTLKHHLIDRIPILKRMW